MRSSGIAYVFALVVALAVPLMSWAGEEATSTSTPEDIRLPSAPDAAERQGPGILTAPRDSTGQPLGRPGTPNHGWSLAPPRLDPAYPGYWVHDLEFCNDSYGDIYVRNLKVAVESDPIDFDGLESFTDWDLTLADVILLPGIGSGAECETWYITALPGTPGSPQHIYGYYEVWETGVDPVASLKAWFDHYDYLSTTPPPSQVETQPPVPSVFRLAQNQPNPFDGATDIRYALPAACHVKLYVYNALGQKMASLVDHHQEAGFRTVHWDAKNENGDRVSSGVYFYRLEAGEFAQTMKMILLK